jgi:hypothetical protein
MRKHQARTKGSKRLRRLAKGDYLVEWSKGKDRPRWMKQSLWKATPWVMTLREIEFIVGVPGFRTEKVTVVTTLLDHKLYRTEDFADLYRRRWMAELFLRDIKTTLGAEVLRCKSPAMVRKELKMFIIAYNLIRALMYEAAFVHGVCRFSLSLKGTISKVRQWAPVMAFAPLSRRRLREMKERLLEYLARDLLPDRPDRTDVRAIKRRPKPYPLLNKPREIFRERAHRNRYQKENRVA